MQVHAQLQDSSGTRIPTDTPVNNIPENENSVFYSDECSGVCTVTNSGCCVDNEYTAEDSEVAKDGENAVDNGTITYIDDSGHFIIEYEDGTIEDLGVVEDIEDGMEPTEYGATSVTADPSSEIPVENPYTEDGTEPTEYGAISVTADPSSEIPVENPYTEQPTDDSIPEIIQYEIWDTEGNHPLSDEGFEDPTALVEDPTEDLTTDSTEG